MQFYRNPVLIVPGIVGSFPTTNDYSSWLLNLGVNPNDLLIDPIANVYNDLIQSFENQGYVLGQDLFAATYDWRLPIAPNQDLTPGAGEITGLDANQLGRTLAPGQFYSTSLDYLVYWLKQADLAWGAMHPGVPLQAVDVVAHSMGGLLTRAYIQSNIYGAAYTDANNVTEDLPKVENLVMLGVPNEGAPGSLNPLENDWSGDPSYQFVLSKILKAAYDKVESGSKVTVVGANGVVDYITKSSILTNGLPDPLKFISAYVPSLQSLSPDYPFISNGGGPLIGVNGDPRLENYLLTDLNGDGSNSWLDDVSNVVDIYGDSVTTTTGVVQRIGSGGSVVPFDDYTSVPTFPGQIWYQQQKTPNSGDGTVPTASLVSNFANNPDRVTLMPFSSNDPLLKVDHLGIVANPNVEAAILDVIDPTHTGAISSGHSYDLDTLKYILNINIDPVQAVLTDTDGKRLGYTQATGVLAEIPNSVYFGQGDGIGWVLGPTAGTPSLNLTGPRRELFGLRGRPHGLRPGSAFPQQGTLAAGQKLTRRFPSTSRRPARRSPPAPPPPSSASR